MTSRRIFRESAVRRYNERLERVELPRPITVPWRRVTWAAAGLLFLLAGLLLAARLPVYAAGPGVLVGDGAGGTDVVALLPADHVAQLRPGQAALVSLDGAAAGDALAAIVIAVEPQPLSPAAARARFDLDATTGTLVAEPVAIARISFDRPAVTWLGSVADVRVQIGRRSGLALLAGAIPGAMENGQ